MSPIEVEITTTGFFVADLSAMVPPSFPLAPAAGAACLASPDGAGSAARAAMAHETQIASAASSTSRCVVLTIAPVAGIAVASRADPALVVPAAARPRRLVPVTVPPEAVNGSRLPAAGRIPLDRLRRGQLSGGSVERQGRRGRR